MEINHNDYDFHGWATKNDLKCTDGRIIRKDAFKHCDGKKVPLCWGHQHDDPMRVLGHALLENRDEGVYAYGKFNDTEQGENAKKLVHSGDICALSIYANQLKQNGCNVMHGEIREVSLVLAGANPGAFIDSIIKHGEESDEEGIIYTGEEISISHSDESHEVVEESAEESVEDISHADEDKKDEKPADGKTVKEVLGTLNEEQQIAVGYVISELIGVKDDTDEDEESESEEVKHNNIEEENDMKENVFDKATQTENTLMHADIVNDAIADGKRFGLLSESLLQHAAANNITDVAELFPMEKDLNMPPKWIKEDDGWVSKIMGAVHHTPFSRVRALFAEMDETEARARGYIKGKEKANLKLAIMKRTTAPTTVYIKMKMDRDDKIDISFDAIPWIRAEARNQLNRELARAFLLGDKRDPGTDDKIDELCIRPVLTDDDVYTIKYTVTDGTDFKNDFNSASENDSEAKGVIRAAVKARKEYKGSGKPTFFTTEDLLTELLLIEDQNGRRIYESETALATAMRVKEIVTIPEMELHTDIYGIIVNMNDYNVGADKGGEVSMFEDFDIDYNQEKFLMETRCSGALVQPKSAIVLKKASAAG
jgi:HK97 family phage prohead protease